MARRLMWVKVYFYLCPGLLSLDDYPIRKACQP